MKLSDYLATNKLTLAEFGTLVKRSDATISRITRGINKPDWDTMKEIERATAGKVTPNDFRDNEAA